MNIRRLKMFGPNTVPLVTDAWLVDKYCFLQKMLKGYNGMMTPGFEELVF